MERGTMMAAKSSRLDSCVFPVVTAVLALAYHALLAALCTYLPRDCLVLGYGLAGYASAGCAASLLGIYGIITRNRILICLFSYSLLLDALVSTCARLLVLELFFDTTYSQNTCPDIIEAIWTDQQQPSYDTVSSPEWQRALVKADRWCGFALGAVHIACVGVLISTCAAQGTLAVAVRKYGMRAGGEEDMAVGVSEKDRLEDAYGVKTEKSEEL